MCSCKPSENLFILLANEAPCFTVYFLTTAVKQEKKNDFQIFFLNDVSDSSNDGRQKNTHPVMSHLEGPCTPVTYIHQINTIALVYISPGLFLEILQVLCFTSHGNYFEQNNKDLSYLQASGSFIIFGIIFYWSYSFLISAS